MGAESGSSGERLVMIHDDEWKEGQVFYAPNQNDIQHSCTQYAP